MSTDRLSTAAKLVSALLALLVVVGAVTVGGVAQTDSQDSHASDADAEPNDSMANATPIEYGEEVNGTLSSGDDVDYYAVNATAGDGVVPRLHLKELFEGSSIAVDVVAPNGDVSTETTNDQMGGPKRVAGEARPLGAKDTAYAADVMESGDTYYVRVQEFHVNGTDGNATYEYELTVNRTGLDRYDPNENGSTAASLELGETANAVYAGYDSDVYAVNLTAGQTYTVDVRSPDQEMSKSLLVFDDASLATDESGSDDADAVAGPEEVVYEENLTFTAEANGTYYVHLIQSGINNQLLTKENYSLVVRESGTPTTPGGGTDDGDADDGDGADESDDSSALPDDGDADSDGLTNARESELGTDPRSSDTDSDGLSDECELRNDVEPTNPDTDGDGTPDGEAV